MANKFRIRDGDALLVSGSVGDHGISVLLAREQFGLRGDLQSDSANVLPLTRALTGMDGLRFMRDPTRGGLASVLNEMVEDAKIGIQIHEADIPISSGAHAVSELLGLDPLHVASEGRMLAVCSAVAAPPFWMHGRPCPKDTAPGISTA